MALIKTSEQNICNIANAIRETVGTTSAYMKSEMPKALMNASWGVDYTYDDYGEPSSVIIYGNTVKGLAGTPSNITISYYNINDITTIGSYAFYNSLIKSYVVPDNVKVIKDNAFYDSSIESITLPYGLERIEDRAFLSCYYLTSLELPETLKYIGNRGISSNSKLISLTIPASVETIKDAFEYSYYLETVIFKGKPTSLSERAFNGCGSRLTSIKVPWAEGEVPGAPWGANYATITYNYTES